MSGNSTVNMCALDMSKAFNKLNHYALFSKLMDHNVPLVLLNILVNWYCMCAAVVQWDSMFSSVVHLVWYHTRRHVSPMLFDAYVNDIVLALSKSGHSCYFDNVCWVYNVPYIDDLLLLSAPVCNLQAMVDI